MFAILILFMCATAARLRVFTPKRGQPEVNRVYMARGNICRVFMKRL